MGVMGREGQRERETEASSRPLLITERDAGFVPMTLR